MTALKTILTPRLGRRRALQVAAGLALTAAAAKTGRAQAAEVADGAPVQTTWTVDGLPAIEALAPHIRATLAATGHSFELESRLVSGNSAGRLYPPIFVRDLNTIQEALAFFLPPAFMRTPVEALLTTQRHFAEDAATAGAVSAVIDRTGRVDKATVVSDEETSAVQAAFAYFSAFGGAAWLGVDVDGVPVIDRLTQALAYVRAARRWGDGELIYRGHTTDWGDVKREPGPEPTDLAPGDGLTLSPFDQAWYYRALHDLAAMLDSVGREAEATAHRDRAEAVREQSIAELWQAEGGHFLIHKHITPWTDPFDETRMVALSNALAIYAGLARPDQVSPLFEALDGAAAAAGTDRAGLSLYPAFPSDFFESRRLAAGEYQNGAVWDWWGGLQIVSEFEHGRAEAGLRHLEAVGAAWEAAAGVYEWFHIPSGTSQGSPDFTGAAGTVAQAVIRGLFGVRLTTDGFNLMPRLGGRSGRLQAVRPGGGAMTVTVTAHPALLFVEYEIDTGPEGAAAVRLPSGWTRAMAFLDGRALPARQWTAGADRYAGAWRVPTGTHTLIVARLD